MTNISNISSIDQAAALIQSVKGKDLSQEERVQFSVDLASRLLQAALETQTGKEIKQQAELANMVNDPIGKAFTTALTDQCFRSRRPSRIADQLVYLIDKYGVPGYLSWGKKWALKLFKRVGKAFSFVLVPLVVKLIRQETARVICPGEREALIAHLKGRKREGVRVNLNHLGEAILSEEEAERRLQLYLDDLSNPFVECISIKISTLFSQINPLAWDSTLEHLEERLKRLYRAAGNKLVNLDMEEFRDLELTVALFRQVLDQPEFYRLQAGIVLQSYLPESYSIQQELTVWAMQRQAKGGAPIKIRIVKGANLAMEQVEASLKGWPQAPYLTKAEVDANYKRMVEYACMKEHAKAVHAGLGTHNVFDIAYGLILRSENGVEEEVGFEMLEGMADPMRRVVQALSGGMLLYCPAAKKEEFQNAVAYLIRRLDENTAPQNFLRAAFHLKPDTQEWEEQAVRFSEAVRNQHGVQTSPQRTQNRLNDDKTSAIGFENEPDTDWSLPGNRKWAENLLNEWKNKSFENVPLMIDGVVEGNDQGEGIDPSFPEKTLYRYAIASEEQIQRALKAAQEAFKQWSGRTADERCELLGKIAENLRHGRASLIGVMAANTGKTIPEADSEVSEAIDFAQYYRKNLAEWSQLEGLEWQPKGTILVAPPWNFPCAIPAGGLLAALAAGNCVIFKPAPEAILVGWELAKLFWQAGVSPKVLQFLVCNDDPEGSRLIQDPSLAAVVLTGSTETAKHFLKLKPALDLVAETGGKNTMVISALADRDLAIKDLLHSAFSYAGQKCSACSLGILEAEVYDDPHFMKQLKEAAASLSVGSPWERKTRVNPLIRPASGALLRGLTTLEEGESWLLKPMQDLDNPHLWTPGIKLCVRPGSFTYLNELFGPVLG
ncbi:MAG: bifunctional proline dehydrogenase/L-glutamate gamma-semialdehyde dehydrogenase, partial [Parachlamydia sp.]|nr:bifunctional proline dehydrogenase/L-glutamate gamma-semialdehyde dehydrogenase [Parachlamydia sp.]